MQLLPLISLLFLLLLTNAKIAFAQKQFFCAKTVKVDACVAQPQGGHRGELTPVWCYSPAEHSKLM